MSAARACIEGADAVQRVVERALRAGASAADSVFVESDSLETRVRDSEIEVVQHASGRTLGVRVLIGTQEGMSTAVTSTSDLALDAIDRAAEQAVALARAIAPDPAAGLPEGGFADTTPDLELCDAGDRSVGVEARIEDARRAEAAARAVDPRIFNSEGSQAGSDFSHVVLANSAGFRGEYETATHALVSAPLARDGEEMQRDQWMTVSHRLAALEDPAAVGRRAAERALRRLGARRVPTCEVPVIFDAVTAPSLLQQLASCLSGTSVYRQASFLADKLGETIASDSITAIDDGRRPGGLGSKPFDGEGLPTRRTALIEKGRLNSFLLDSYSARKLGLASTGNASRGPGSSPGVSPTNLWIEPGTESFEEIVARTERGLWVTELIGMGFNPVTGDYSRGATGLWIEHGEVVHAVEEVTVAGNLGDMLTNIDAVGSELLWLGQFASPALRVARMTLAGE